MDKEVEEEKKACTDGNGTWSAERNRNNIMVEQCIESQRRRFFRDAQGNEYEIEYDRTGSGLTYYKSKYCANDMTSEIETRDGQQVLVYSCPTSPSWGAAANPRQRGHQLGRRVRAKVWQVGASTNKNRFGYL